MTSGKYLDQYLESLETLPLDIQRNFALMRDLDTRAQNVMKGIDRLADEFFDRMNSLSSSRKKELMHIIQKNFNKAKAYGDDKVQLAIQTYELVDKHIRKLDADLIRFESEILDKAMQNKKVIEPKKRGRKKKTDVLPIQREVPIEEHKNKPGRRKKKGNVGRPALQNKSAKFPPTIPVQISSKVLARGTDVLDMPVDPNEPTYCLCQQVSYGEMIGCDNVDCTIEWFHFVCVGLSIKPKGKWFCPRCSEDRKKK